MGNDDAATLTVGVLELQGAFAEHTAMLRRAGAEKVVGVREPAHLDGLDALVLPGGESTVQGKLLRDLGMLERVKELVAGGLPIFGTCAGAILLAARIRGRPTQTRIGALDVEVARNAYGAQLYSFEATAPADAEAFGADAAPLRIVQIRAPAFVDVGASVRVLASHGSTPVLVQQQNVLAATFHPELTDDPRVHAYFLRIASRRKAES